MLWFSVFKTDPQKVGFVVNTYYGDFQTFAPHDLEACCVRVAEFDRAWCAQSTEVQLVAVQNANLGDKLAGNAGYVWAPTPGTFKGKRVINDPLPPRWTRRVKAYGTKRHYSNHYYPFSISREELNWGDRGQIVWRPVQSREFGDADALGIEGGKWPEWYRMAVGSSQIGEALAFRPPTAIRTEGITIKNKARRGSARTLNYALAWMRQAIGACQAASYSYAAQWSVRGLDMPDFISIEARAQTLAIMSVTLEVARMLKDKQKGKDGQRVNNDAGWNVRFGVTGATIEGAFSKLDQKNDNDLQEIGRLVPGTDSTGESYWHRAEAETLWQIADDWFGYLGQFAMFDYLCPVQTGLEDESRVDDFTPLYPDLPTHVEGLPQPIKNPHRLHEPGGL